MPTKLAKVEVPAKVILVPVALILPEESMAKRAVPAVVKIMAWEELAVKVLLLEMRVVLAAIIVKELVAEIVLVLMVIVLPMVVVPTYMLAHLAVCEPMLYVRLAFGKRSPVIVVVPTARVPLKIALPVP